MFTCAYVSVRPFVSSDRRFIVPVVMAVLRSICISAAAVCDAIVAAYLFRSLCLRSIFAYLLHYYNRKSVDSDGRVALHRKIQINK